MNDELSAEYLKSLPDKLIYAERNGRFGAGTFRACGLPDLQVEAALTAGLA